MIDGATNGLVTFNRTDPVNFYVNVLADMNTGTSLQQGVIGICDDGRYMLNGSAFLTYNGSQFQISVFENFSDGVFRPDNNDELISAASPTPIANGTNGSILRTITPPDNSYKWKSYDPVTHMLLYTKDETYKSYLINIDTNVVTTVNGTGVAFINGILIDAKGNYIKLM